MSKYEKVTNTDIMTGLSFETKVQQIPRWENPCTHGAAVRQVRAIKKYWREFGYDIKTEIIPHVRSKSYQSFFIVASDMINGLPKGWRG
jgi:hypothetical protein